MYSQLFLTLQFVILQLSSDKSWAPPESQSSGPHTVPAASISRALPDITNILILLQPPLTDLNCFHRETHQWNLSLLWIILVSPSLSASHSLICSFPLICCSDRVCSWLAACLSIKQHVARRSAISSCLWLQHGTSLLLVFQSQTDLQLFSQFRQQLFNC